MNTDPVAFQSTISIQKTNDKSDADFVHLYLLLDHLFVLCEKVLKDLPLLFFFNAHIEIFYDLHLLKEDICIVQAQIVSLEMLINVR